MVRNRPAISYWSPLPPSRSGVADYSRDLLPHLSARCDVRIVSEPGNDPPRLPGVRQPDPLPPVAECLPIYQMGNNVDFHSFVYDAACRHPGILVLHDTCLGGFHFEYYRRRGQTRRFFDELEYCEGEASASAFWGSLRGGSNLEALVGVPMLRRLVETSRAVIVHNSAWRQLLLDRYRQPRVHRMTLGSDVNTESRPREGGGQALKVGAFGIVYETKRIDVLLRAAAAVLAQNTRLTLEIVGPWGSRALRDQLTQLARDLGIERDVHFVGETGAAEFERRLKECDVVVNLRYPSHGEASAVMMRAFGAGKPVIASDIPAFSDFSAEHCVRIPVGEGETEVLSRALLHLAHHPRRRLEMGRSAQQMVRSEATWPVIASRYRAIIDDVLGRSEPEP